MKKIVQILVVLVLFASCGGGNKNSESGNMSSVQHEEYENMLASLQRVEILLDDVGEMSVDQIVSLSEFVPQLHYEYDKQNMAIIMLGEKQKQKIIMMMILINFMMNLEN